MSSSFLRKWGALIFATLLCANATASDLEPIDEVFDIRVDLAWGKDGEAAAFALVEKAFTRTPRPHVKTRYGEMLMTLGLGVAPAGEAGRGMDLVQEALDEGSVRAKAIVGWELLRGQRLPADPTRGLALLQEAVTAGNIHAMIVLGRAYRYGVGMPADVQIAELWFRRAAYLGSSQALYSLGHDYELGGIAGRADEAKAFELYLEAAIRGSDAAGERLKSGMESGEPRAARAHHLVILWYAAAGADFQRRQVKSAIAALEQSFPDDPVVLLALGRVYSTEGFGLRDYEKAHVALERAIRLGSADARAERAKLLAVGAGVKKDPAAALAEWRALEKRGNARALAELGFYHYWNSLKGTDVTKDPAKAFAYSRRAANAGDFWGQLNVAYCYEHGIGVDTNYALAARYNRAAAWRGSREGARRMYKLLDHVK
ncbi:MAG TPA: tetratricopeptide repeat protein [Opitutaceae bacterium]